MPPKNYGTLKQPAPVPTPGAVDVWELVIKDLEDGARNDAGWAQRSQTVDLVLADMRGRHAHGLEEYNTPLQPHDGRDSLADPYQEALDLVAYLRRVIEEGGAWAQASYLAAVGIAFAIREAIAARDAGEVARA